MTLRQLLGIDLPIIQAPMAGAQGSAMAIAVSNAGGLGSLPCAMLSLEAMRNELATIKAQTDRPFNVNFFCHTPPTPDIECEAAWKALLSPYYNRYGIDPETVPVGTGRASFGSEAADVLEKFKPAVVSFHFGLPSAELLARIKAMGSKIFSSATTVEEARWLEAHGVDAVIAQGLEAGGHRGIFLSEDLTTQVGTFALVPQIVREVKLPVIAAGGIADARGVAAAMALGAAGVQIGTAYLLCPEATISAVHRAALKSKAARHTALTNIFTGRPARGIVNQIMKELGPINAAAPAFPLATSAIAPLRAIAESHGSSDFSPLWSGQNASGCKEIPAADLTRELAGSSASLFSEASQSIALRIGHIYFRPLMYGLNAGEVEMALDLYHSFWAQLLDKERELSEVVRAVANEQECGAANFAHRHRLNHPESSEQERVEYVVQQWRKISKLVGLPVPYSKIRSGFEGNERLRALFPDEEN